MTKLIISRSPGKQVIGEPNIRINNCNLKLYTNANYLGIFINKVSFWNKQIGFICSKSSRALGILFKLRHNALRHYSIFYSRLSHGLTQKKLIWIRLIS